jgi:DNA-binding response OmpR family regulator
MESTRNDEEIYDDGYLRVEHKRYFVSCKETQIALSKTEFRLCSRMARSLDRVVRAVDLWEYAWGNHKPLNHESLHVTMCRLRRKFEAYGLRIDSMIGVGYSLSYRSRPPESSQPEPQSESQQDRIADSPDC